MTKTTHMAIGLYASLLTNTFFVFTIAGATFPDIDVKWSYKKTSEGYKPNYALPKWLGHRGITHCWFPYAVLYALSFFVHPIFKIMIESFLIGIITHLIADIATPAGIPIHSFKKRTSLKLLKTKSTTEYLILAILAAGLIIVPHSMYVNQLSQLDFYLEFFKIK